MMRVMTPRTAYLFLSGFIVTNIAASSACDGGARERAPLAIGAHRFRSDGVELAYHVAGAGPLCIAHPGGPGMEWRYLRMPELERRLTIVYLEPAGTGASGQLVDRDGYTRARYAADLENLRRQLGRDRVCLLGHSAGAKAVIEYAIAYPQRVDRLILYATSAVTDAEWKRDTEAARQARANEPWFAAAEAGFHSDAPLEPEECGLARTAPFYFADWTGRQREFVPLIAELRCWPASRKGKPPAPDDQRPALAGVSAPALVAIGRHDFLFPPKWGQITADALPNGKLVIFEQSGHFAHVEEPAAFAAAIAEFVGAG